MAKVGKLRPLIYSSNEIAAQTWLSLSKLEKKMCQIISHV